MKFATRKDIEAPQDRVFAALSDFAAFERQARKRGIDILRTDGDGPAGAGAAWRTRIDYHKKTWTIDSVLTEFDPPAGYRMRGTGDGLILDLAVDVRAVSPGVTRIIVTLDVQPQKMSARLMVQSLKLIRGRLDEGFDTRIATLARRIEERHRPVA